MFNILLVYTPSSNWRAGASQPRRSTGTISICLYVAIQQSQSQASLPAHRASSRSPLAEGRECNVILFGLPENQTIVEAKGVVDEMFDFLIGKQVQIKDILRLGRFRSPASPSSRPRPLLIKLCTVWDL